MYRVSFISLLVALLLNGCLYYIVPKQSEKVRKQPCWIKKPICIKDRYPISASGSGSNEKEAKIEAYNNLAQQIGVQVYNSREEKSTENDQKYDDDISNVSKLTTSEKIKFSHIADKYKTLDGNYHVLIFINTEALDSFYDLKIVSEMIEKLENYYVWDINDVDRAKKMVSYAKKYLGKINFKLLNRYNASNNQNRAILNYKIYNIEKNLKGFEKKIEHYNNLSNRKQKSVYFEIIDNFSKGISQICSYIEETYSVSMNYNTGCEIFLTKDKKGICKEYCGDNPKIKIDTSLTTEEILLLAKNKKLNSFANKLFVEKRDMLILKHLMNTGD